MLRPRWLAPLILVAASLTGALAQQQQSTQIWFQAWDYEMPGERQFYADLVRAFHAAHPSLAVKFTLGKWADAHRLIEQWVTAGKGPDLVVIPDIWIPEFAERLAAYPENLPAGELQRFYPVLVEKARFNGKVYGLVWATSTKALLYRRDLLAKAGLNPPATWHDLLAAAKAAHNPPAVYGIGLPAKRDYDTTDNFYFFLWSAGGDFFDSQGRVALDNELAVASMQWYSDLYLRHRVTQPSPTAWHRNQCQRLFEDGRLAMFETGPWAVAALAKHHPQLDYAVAPLPIAPSRINLRVGNKVHPIRTRPSQITQVITDHLMLTDYSPHKQAALQFIRFAYQRKWRQRFCELGMVPELVEVGNSAHFQKDPRWKIFVDALAHGRYVPLMKWEPVELALQEGIWSVFSGRWNPLRACRHAAHMLRVQVAAQRARKAPPQHPWLRIVQITDPHFDTVSKADAGRRRLTASRQLLASAVRLVNEKLRPDVTVVTGDLVNLGTAPGQLEGCARLLSKLQGAWFTVLGNHDGPRATYEKLFGPSCRAFTAAGRVRCIILGTYQNTLRTEDLQFLRRELSAHPRTPAIIFTHHSLLRDEDIRAAHGAGEPLQDQEPLRGILRQFPNVLAIISGHHHINLIRPTEGVLQFVSSALVEPPHQVHLYELGPSGLLLTRYSLGDAATRPSWRPAQATAAERLFFDLRWADYAGRWLP